MGLNKLFMIGLLVGTLGLIGCGSDDGGTTENGDGGTTGNGGDECNTGECVNDSTRRTACETAVAACKIGPAALEEGCIQAAIADACLDQTNPI